MILTKFTGWTGKFTADGMILLPPEGPEIGMIKIRSRQRPMRTAKDIIDTLIADLSKVGYGIQVRAVDDVTTAEAEHAVTATVAGTLRSTGKEFERTLGIVYGDDFYERADCLCADPAQFEIFRQGVRELVIYTVLGLGLQRRRYYKYTPPPGWSSLPHGLVAEWYPADFPRNHSVLTIPPARPVDRIPPFLEKRLLDNAMLDVKRETISEPQTVHSDFGLTGQMYVVRGTRPSGQRVVFDLISLVDTQFAYSLRMESPADRYDDNHAVVMRVLRSCEAIPAQHQDLEQKVSVHWVD